MSMSAAPQVELRSLDTLWFQVSGTLCNLACTHCLVSASPTNRTHDHLSLETVERYLDEGVELGVKESYFTGGEPFLNPQMEAIIAKALEYGPVTVLTNGLLLDAARCERLAALSSGSRYSLDFRISLDGYDAASNDAIRGAGTFDRILRAVARMYGVGLNPVITVTEVCRDVTTEEGRRRFFELLAEHGIAKARLKILPLFHIGEEEQRTGAYADWQRLLAADRPEEGWDHLQCSSCRMVTSRGVWVCPILINEPSGRMGEHLADTLNPYPLSHQACWTCHVQGASCST